MTLDLAPLETALAEATPGPWKQLDVDGGPLIGTDSGDLAEFPDTMQGQLNALLVLLLRNSAPELIAELKHLRAKTRELESLVDARGAAIERLNKELDTHRKPADLKAFLPAAEQLRRTFPFDEEEPQRRTLAVALWTAVQVVAKASKLLVPNGVRWTIGGPDGDYKIAVMRPGAEESNEDALVRLKFKIRELRARLFEERAKVHDKLVSVYRLRKKHFDKLSKIFLDVAPSRYDPMWAVEGAAAECFEEQESKKAARFRSIAAKIREGKL